MPASVYHGLQSVDGLRRRRSAAAVRYGIGQAVKAGTLTKEQYWHPHQLRHSYATLVRRAKGLGAARALLGHRTVTQTAEYAELDNSIGARVAAELG